MRFKKFGEESIEVVLAAMGEDREHLIYKLADLKYHLTLLLSAKDIEWSEFVNELIRRH
ncbi:MULTISPECIES: phosphoribosyl-ATP diphosphatase [Fervidobacterium]|uniref:phosphoribosyl-ATP diphosphatase n=1 Tax=Fervidobacterium TaxID=2422 RepID=UPI0034321BD4